MAGIYLHIPFCRRACHYCNFHFSTSLALQNDFLTALLKEISLQKDFLQGEPVGTIYFGGGTPSLLENAQLESILRALQQHFSISDDAEITLEANPDDIDAQKLSGWKQAGINRLSIGIQSFFEEDLQWMNRAHNATQAYRCLSLALEQFGNITIDLIYGSPGLTDDKWKRNVATAIDLGIPHLSCYALTVEPKTALDSMIRSHKSKAVNSEDQARHFLLLMDWLQQAGYEHYEISNFALPGHRSRHNSSYWQGKKYLGLGPSAHSFNGTDRQWNIANNALYIQSLKNDVVPFELETLTETQRLNEYIMTGLRTLEGINLSYIRQRFGKWAEESIRKASRTHIDGLLLEEKGSQLRLTGRGKLLCDGITVDLFSE